MKSGWHQMADGDERNVMVCRSHLSYIIIEKQSDMERRHGSPRIVTSHSFPLTTLQSSLSPSPMRSFGERVMLWLGNKKKKKEISGCSAICPEKMPVGGMLQAKVHRLHQLNGSILVQGEEKRICRNEWVTVGVWGRSKKGWFSIFPYSVAPRG